VIALNIKVDLKPLQRAFIDLRSKQVPFATALALTTLAKGAQALERADILETFPTATPFTQGGVAITPATKSRQVATVFIKDIQSAYLEPFVDGGVHYLGGKRGLLVPKGINVNQYGNLPKGKLQALKGKPGIFVGSVKTKHGLINGVWQRPVAASVATKGSKRGTVAKPRAPMKLLIRFEDPQPVKEHLDFYRRAERYLRANAPAVFNQSMRKALATAR
jgi:hypothetical protein